MNDKIILTVLAEDAGKRLDSYIGEAIENVSRSHAAKLIEDGLVTVGEGKPNKKYLVKENDVITVEIPMPEDMKTEAENIPLDIVYEDDSVIVINKPQGLVVHPGAGNWSGTLVNALLYYAKDSLSGINGVLRPGIVHRIDKDTSGLIIVAKNDMAHISLSAQLADRSLSRIYYALVNGNIKEDEFTLDFPIGRNPTDRKKMCVTDKNSRNAVTHVRVMERFGRYTLVSCKLQTGRTHQIRVHMAHIGHSVVGDKTYGIKKEAFRLEGQLLHAKEISFIHPVTKEKKEFSCPLPDYFTDVLNKLRKG